MADMTLHTTVFPDGSDVGAFAATDWPLPYPPEGEPDGSPVAYGTVAGNTVTFTGLARGVSYWVTFTDPGLDRYPYMFFTVPVPESDGAAPAPISIGDEGSGYLNGASGSLVWYEQSGRLWVEGVFTTGPEQTQPEFATLPYSDVVGAGLALSGTTVDSVLLSPLGVLSIGAGDVEPESGYFIQLSALVDQGA